MNTNDNNQIDLDADIQELRKKVYLEDPDLWFKFTDKVNDNVFDEMVVFYAAKYNFLSIIKHAIENNLIDLNSPSQNKSFNAISSNLIYTAAQSSSTDVYNYLKNPSNNDTTSVNSTDVVNDANNSNSYFPEFICPTCNLNLFECGYIASENIVFKFSSKDNKSIEVDRNLCDYISCASCNSAIKDTSIKDLENIYTIQNCNKCGVDLTSNGIIDKRKMEFDNKSNKFITGPTSYHCANCSNEVSKKQRDFFSI